MTVVPGEYVYSPKVRDSSVVRKEISQFSQATVGLTIVFNGQRTYADDESVKLTLWVESDFDDTNLEGEIQGVYAEDDPLNPIRKVEVGVYEVTLDTSVTKGPALIKALWEYTYQGKEFQYVDFYQIVDPMPTYDNLTEEQKSVVTQVQWMLADLFDNTTGGVPHFAEEFQSNWGAERIAQLMQVGLQKVNFSSQPVTYYAVGPGGTNGMVGLPPKYSGILLMATYLEVLRHFCRTYVEQPSYTSTAGVAMADRRDYLQRWQSILQSEEENFKNMVRLFKRDHLNFGSGALIVGGGIYGSGGSFQSGSWAAAARGMRFYPTSTVVLRP